MTAQREIASKVVGLEGCQLFGISAAEQAYGQKTATVTCVTQDRKLAAQYTCLITNNGGHCVPNGYVAKLTP